MTAHGAYALMDTTTGQTWDQYVSEAALKTATRLYAIAHPRNGITVVIAGQTHVLRSGR